ncbi:methionine ABC transporter ATP-binding protein [Cohnella laeviribosi]|jgi:D-methionine transport system ATP-binding protein|uniref:methionine ABC transporter ATP-binding protein n=1 Tax=Cohnella laeviribosi TaxID=380174 RepID=UPI003D25E357
MIQLVDVCKAFKDESGNRQQVLQSVSLNVEEGDIYGVIGFSGAGKSTLLRTMNLLERPDSGQVIVGGENLMRLSRKELLQKRLSIGMIFQSFNLLGNRTVYENVSFPLEIARVPRAERRGRIEASLEKVGLLDKANAYPAKLSGGQKQRVAIARAMVMRPRILLCDEPTSALDPQTTQGILDFLKQLNEEEKITMVIVTHEMEVVKSICNKVSVMEGGRLVETHALVDRPAVPQSQLARYLFEHQQQTAIRPEEVNVHA